MLFWVVSCVIDSFDVYTQGLMGGSGWEIELLNPIEHLGPLSAGSGGGSWGWCPTSLFLSCFSYFKEYDQDDRAL